MIETKIKDRFDYLEARLDTIACKMDEELDAVKYSPMVSELDIIRRDIEDLRMSLHQLDAMIEHEQEQRKKFMIALIEAGEEGLL